MAMKKYAILITAILVSLLSGCTSRYPYSLAQDIDNIAQVEIREYDYDTRTTKPLCVLDEETARSLLTEICGLQCKKHFGDHTTDYGDVVVYISYLDGTAEVLGQCNVAQVNKDGEWSIGIKYFDRKEYYRLIMKYADPYALPDLSKYFY